MSKRQETSEASASTKRKHSFDEEEKDSFQPSPAYESPPAAKKGRISKTLTTTKATTPSRSRPITEFMSPSRRAIIEAKKLIAEARVVDSGQTFDNVEALAKWLRVNSSPLNPKTTPLFDFDGVVMGGVTDNYNNKSYKRLFVWDGSATDEDVEEFKSTFEELFQLRGRSSAQQPVLTLTVWSGLEDDTFAVGDRIKVSGIKQGALYNNISCQGWVSSTEKNIVRK